MNTQPQRIEEQEIWKYVPQFDGYLQASNLGNIREYIQIIKSDGLPHVIKNNVLKPNENNKTNIVSYKGKFISVNRLIFSAFFYIPKTSFRILHKDGNIYNRRPDNLYCEDSSCKGETNYQAKLDATQIYKLCYDFVNGYKAKALAEKYNIHFMNVYRVLRNNIWQSVNRPKITRQIIKKDKKNILAFLEKKLIIENSKKP